MGAAIDSRPTGSCSTPAAPGGRTNRSAAGSSPGGPGETHAFADTYEHGSSLKILFIGQAVERKGLPVLLRAFEALREQVPATLTLVGASAAEIAPMLLDYGGVRALGKVSEEHKLRELRDAEVLCAPSLSGESFGMGLTEAFAAATPVVASDIPGYRDVAREGLRSARAARRRARALLRHAYARARPGPDALRWPTASRSAPSAFRWTHVAEEVSRGLRAGNRCGAA